MKAAVYVGDPATLAIEDLKPNPPGPRDVVVEIGASGVCHSDLSIMRGYVPVPGSNTLNILKPRCNTCACARDGRSFTSARSSIRMCAWSSRIFSCAFTR